MYSVVYSYGDGGGGVRVRYGEPVQVRLHLSRLIVGFRSDGIRTALAKSVMDAARARAFDYGA